MARELRAVLVVLAVTAACGGATSSGIDGPSSTPDGGSSGILADASGGAAYTLDDVCEKTAPRTCALRKPCCEKTATYDEQGCIARAKAECAKDVADVRAGKSTFRPERIDDCFAKLGPVFDNCSLTFDVLASVAKVLGECRVFEGNVPKGGACTRDGECAAGGPSSFPSCDVGTKTCRTVSFLPSGSACELAEPPTGFCDEALFCDANLTLKPPSGTCKIATGIGKPCDAGKAIDLQCGLGNYCEKGTGLCAKGKGANAPCANGFECASFSCLDGVAGKRCAPPGDIVKREDCGAP